MIKYNERELKLLQFGLTLGLMKKLILSAALFILIGCSKSYHELEDRVKFQAEKSSTQLSFLQIKRNAYYILQWSKDDAFQDEINEFKKLDSISPPEKGSILFTGSSSIRFWDSLEKDMKPLKVLNRGFGGAHISHVIHHFKDIVEPYNPKAIVFFCGTNDLTALKSPEETIDDFKKFLNLARKNLKDIKVYVIGIKPSVSRLYLDEQEKTYNSSISALANEDPFLEYIDVWNSMLNKDGTRMSELYIEDGLHMNKKGYEVWTKLVRETLAKDFNL